MATVKRVTVTEKKKKPMADFSKGRKASAANLAGKKMSVTPTKAAPKSTSTPLADLMAQNKRRKRIVTRK